ncbi:MAG: hypothetical protein KIS90_15285 [Phenylobacterium sp.]|nr:hypothetical protein [Phenylobacterium sp.]
MKNTAAPKSPGCTIRAPVGTVRIEPSSTSMVAGVSAPALKNPESPGFARRHVVSSGQSSVAISEGFWPIGPVKPT